MVDDTSDANEDPGEDALGAPVGELRALRDPVPSTLLGRVHNSIRRRELAADVTRFSLWTPFLVLLEYLTVLFEAFGPKPGSGPDQESS
ncbi:MAG: hypothetical protein R3E10_10790 [Gemmatimonadota bacterium]